MREYNLALCFQLVGVLVLVTGVGLAGVAFEVARREDKPSEIALLLGLTRLEVLLVAAGMLGASGLLLVHVGDFGYSTGWVDSSISLFIAALILGGLGGQRLKQARCIATRLHAANAPASDKLCALLDDPLSRAANHGSLLTILAVAVLMVFNRYHAPRTA